MYDGYIISYIKFYYNIDVTESCYILSYLKELKMYRIFIKLENGCEILKYSFNEYDYKIWLRNKKIRKIQNNIVL